MLNLTTPGQVEQLLREEGTEWVGDAAPEIIGDINVSPALSAHKDELIRGARAKYELGILRQRHFKAANDRIERAHVDGLGRQVASFDPQVFLQLEKSYGRGWWRDRKKLHSFLKENPMFAIRVNPGFTNGRSFSVRVDGLRDGGGQRTEDRGQEEAGIEAGAGGLVRTGVVHRQSGARLDSRSEPDRQNSRRLENSEGIDKADLSTPLRCAQDDKLVRARE